MPNDALEQASLHSGSPYTPLPARGGPGHLKVSWQRAVFE